MVKITCKRSTLCCMFWMTLFATEFVNEVVSQFSNSHSGHNTDPCSSSPCMNRGVCIQTLGRPGFRCDCVNDYKGYICQHAPGNIGGLCTNDDRISCQGEHTECHEGVCQCKMGYYSKGNSCRDMIALKVSGLTVSLVSDIALVDGEMCAKVSWNLPTDPDAVYQYEVRWSYSGGPPEAKIAKTSQTAIVKGLLAGTTYNIEVHSIDYSRHEPQSVATSPVVITTKTVCSTRQVRNGIHEFRNLINCTVIEGSLNILLIDHPSSEDYMKLHFPKLVEITDYMLLYRVYSLKTLRNMFPNLAVIRGQQLFYNFALVAFEMVDLEELGLVSLTVIERGAIRLEKNPNLCYVTTVDWSRIAIGVKEEDHFIKENENPAECVNVCPVGCPTTTTTIDGKRRDVTRCWTSDDCQKMVTSCSSCRTDRGQYCYKSGGRDLCCNNHCLGGCYGEGSNDCIACKHVAEYSSGRARCMPHCFPGTFMYKNRRCLLDHECMEMRMKIIESRHSAGQCVRSCPAGYTEDEKNHNKCIPCTKECPKECPPVRVDSIHAAQGLKGCTVITGPLEIRIMKGSNIGQELEENLGQIEEVQGHIWVHSSHALLSLFFFKSLRKIHGENLYNGFSLLVNDNVNLQKLFPEDVENKLEILNGNLFFHFNRKLCLNKIREFESKVKMNASKSKNDISDTTNGDQMPCYVTQLNLTILSVSSTVAFLKWENFKIPDARNLLSYVIYYKEAPFQNVSIYDGRDACSNDVWETKDVLNKSDKPGPFLITLVVNLKPWTQYAVYVQTYTTASATYGAMSKLLYFRTAPAMPTSPANLVVKSLRENELLVSWKPPLHPHGNVTHYEVYWRKREIVPQQYSRRNYCKDPLKMTDLDTKKKNQEIQKEERAKNETTNGKCCACPRSEEDKKSELIEREIQIKFENFLQNIVYTKRRDSLDVEPGKTRAVKPLNVTKSKKSGSRRKRKRNARPSPIDKHETGKYTANPEKSENDANETTINETRKAEAAYFKAQVFGTELILTSLGHFEDYNIEVIACQERDPRDPKKLKLCSNRAITMGRTLPNETADVISPASVKVTQNSTDVLVTWEDPVSPNGLIITYHIEYNHTSHVEPQRICIPYKNYLKGKGYKLSVEKLSPANYSFRIRATSLAGPGPWTANRYFIIPSKLVDPGIKEVWIAVVVSLVLLGLLVGFIIVWCCARRKFSNIPEMVLHASANENYISYQDAYEADEWEVDRDNVKLLKELGQGSFGMVYEGILFEEDKKMDLPVAVKTVNEHATFQERTNFLKEASIMKGFKCHHVVQLLGVVSKGQPALVIMELMSNGDLKNFLRLHRPDEEDNDGRMPPTLRRIMQMAGEIADGMAYLADKKFVHRDLAARNCMVAADLTVKIGDFGMTRDIYETDYYRKGGKGLLPVRWMGPESLKDGIFTSMSDVWSYGVVLWEMATLAAQPYQGLSNEEVLKYVLSGKIMERPDGCPQRLFDLMTMCWQFRPKQRPTFKEIIEILVPELDPEFREKSYFFSEENKQDYGIDDIDIDIEDVNHDQDDSQMPFIGATGKALSEASGGSHDDLSEELDFVDSDYKSNNYPHVKFSTEPCDCVMLQETNTNSNDHNHRNSSCSFNNSAIGSSDGSKDSSKSSTGSYAHINGLNVPQVANGHIPAVHMRMTSC